MEEALPDAERWELTNVTDLARRSGTLATACKDFVLVEVQRSDLPCVRVILEALDHAVATDGRLAVFLKERSSLEDGEDLAEQIVRNVEHVAPRDLSRADFSFAGGNEKRMAWAVLHDWLAVYARRGVFALPSVTWGIWLALRRVRELNLREKAEQDARSPRTHLSSFLMVVKR